MSRLLFGYPFPAIAGLLLAGMGCGWLLARRLMIPPVWWGLAIGVILLFTLLELRRGERRELIAGLLTGVMLVAGAGLFQIQLAPLIDNPLEPYADGQLHELEGEVDTLVKRTGSGYHFLLEARKVDGEKLETPAMVSVFVQRMESPEAGGSTERAAGSAENPESDSVDRDGQGLPLWQDRLSVLTSLEKPEGPTFPGGFDARTWLWTQGAGMRAFVPKPDMVERLNRERHWVAQVVETSGQVLFGAVRDYLSGERAELFISLIYGDKVVNLDPELEENFRRAGLMHILVVSGSQLSLLAGWLWLIFRPLAWFGRGSGGRLAAVILLGGGLVWFALITGFQISIQRSLWMAAFLAVNRYLFTNFRLLDGLAMAALVIALFNPLIVLSPSFQLSFGATLGLIVGLRVTWPFLETLNRVERYFAATFVATVGAQLAVAPLLALHFNQLNPWGPFSNLFAIPAASVILLVGTVANLIWVAGIPLLGQLMAWVTGSLVDLLAGFAAWVADLPFSALVVREPPVIAVLLLYSAMAVAGFWLWKLLRNEDPGRLPRFATVGLLTVLTLWWGLAEMFPASGTELASHTGYRILHHYREGDSRLLLVEVPEDDGQAVEQLRRARRMRSHHGQTGSDRVVVMGPASDPPDDMATFLPGARYLGPADELRQLSVPGRELSAVTAFPEKRIRPSWVVNTESRTLLGVGEEFRWGKEVPNGELVLAGSPGRLRRALSELPERQRTELTLVLTHHANEELFDELAYLAGVRSESMTFYDLAAGGWVRLKPE